MDTPFPLVQSYVLYLEPFLNSYYKEYQNIISKYLGVEPIEINSNLLSCQNRTRLYWTNIPNIQQPENKNIVLNDILDNNIDKDLVLVPRINTVEGLTEAHIQKWGWNVNEKGWVNFPDVQTRIYKNSDKIYWVNKVHERIVGFESYTNFPADEIYCIRHPKTIDRQERQNNYYDTL